MHRPHKARKIPKRAQKNDFVFLHPLLIIYDLCGFFYGFLGFVRFDRLACVRAPT